MTKSFLAIGECMVELAPQEGGLYAVGFAGDTFNTAWYARRTFAKDWKIGYLTGVGTDDVSDRMVRFMEEAGIETDQIQRRKDRTVGLYMISLKDGERSFSYWRSVSAARMLGQDPGLLDAALDGVELAYFSGITLAILDGAGRDTLLQALDRAKSKGTCIAFDPNLRPRLWASDSEMCAAITQAAGVADIVLPSFDDEARFFGDIDPEGTAQRYLRAGAGGVVVKDGPGAVLFARGQERSMYQPQAVQSVVDTTAAGDSFNAGFLAEWMASGRAEMAMAAGAQLAGQVIGARGALVDVKF